MEVIFMLIGIGLLVTSSFLISFLFAVKEGQYEDTYSPAVRILFDDNNKTEEKTTNQIKQS